MHAFKAARHEFTFTLITTIDDLNANIFPFNQFVDQLLLPTQIMPSTNHKFLLLHSMYFPFVPVRELKSTMSPYTENCSIVPTVPPSRLRGKNQSPFHISENTNRSKMVTSIYAEQPQHNILKSTVVSLNILMRSRQKNRCSQPTRARCARRTRKLYLPRHQRRHNITGRA